MYQVKLPPKIKNIICLILSFIFLQSCQTQKLHYPYFVYQIQLNNSTCSDEEFKTICNFSQKSTEYIFFRDYIYCYFNGSIVDRIVFCDLYTKRVGVPNDYTIEVWYNLLGIPAFKMFKWSPTHFNSDIDILTRQ